MNVWLSLTFQRMTRAQMAMKLRDLADDIENGEDPEEWDGTNTVQFENEENLNEIED